MPYVVWCPQTLRRRETDETSHQRRRRPLQQPRRHHKRYRRHTFRPQILLRVSSSVRCVECRSTRARRGSWWTRRADTSDATRACSGTTSAQSVTPPVTAYFLEQRTRTNFVRGSITVRLTSCLIGLDSTKLLNLYLIQHNQSSWILKSQTVGQPYSDNSPY